MMVNKLSNALHLPWIDVLTAEKTAIKASVLDIFNKPNHYLDLVGDTLHQASAINFLIALAQDSGWPDPKWKKIDQTRFDLCGQSPFYQFGNLNSSHARLYPHKPTKKVVVLELKDIGELVWYVPSGTKISWAFIPHVYSGSYALCTACVLRHIVELPLFSRAGGNGRGVSVSDESSPLYAFKWGQTVGETIQKNIVSYGPAAWNCVKALGTCKKPHKLTVNEMYSIMPRMIEVMWQKPQHFCLLCGDNQRPQAQSLLLKGITFDVSGKPLLERIPDPRLLIKTGKTLTAFTNRQKLAEFATTNFIDDNFRIFGLQTKQEKVLATVTLTGEEARDIVNKPVKEVQQPKKFEYNPCAFRARNFLREMKETHLAKIRSAYEHPRGYVIDPEVSKMFEEFWRKTTQNTKYFTKYTKPAVFAVFVAFAYNNRMGYQRCPVSKVVNAISMPMVLAHVCSEPDWAYILTVLLEQ